MPRPYPREFRDDVVRVARNRADRVTIEQIATAFGIHPMTLTKWMRQAAIDDGDRPDKSPRTRWSCGSAETPNSCRDLGQSARTVFPRMPSTSIC